MKKRFRISLFLLIAILLLALCGCSTYHTPEADSVNSQMVMGPSYVLYFNQETILYNGTTYHYSVSRNGDNVSFTITYPNGGLYYSNQSGNSITSGGNKDYDENTYVSGETLVEILRSHYYVSHTSPIFGNILIFLICLGVGGFHAFFPKDGWYLAHALRAWQYESIEPSESGLLITRIGGVIVMIIGVFALFLAWS